MPRGGDTRKGGGNMIQCQYVEPYRQSSRHILSGDYQCWVVDFARRSLACSCSTQLRELGQQGRGGGRGYDNFPVGVLSAASLVVTVLYMDCNQAEISLYTDRMLRGHSSGLRGSWCGQLVLAAIRMKALVCWRWLAGWTPWCVTLEVVGSRHTCTKA